MNLKHIAAISKHWGDFAGKLVDALHLKRLNKYQAFNLMVDFFAFIVVLVSLFILKSGALYVIGVLFFWFVFCLVASMIRS